jgi:hypothetical protein
VRREVRDEGSSPADGHVRDVLGVSVRRRRHVDLKRGRRVEQRGFGWRNPSDKPRGLVDARGARASAAGRRAAPTIVIVVAGLGTADTERLVDARRLRAKDEREREQERSGCHTPVLLPAYAEGYFGGDASTVAGTVTTWRGPRERLATSSP